jgi:hypothetical protein
LSYTGFAFDDSPFSDDGLDGNSCGGIYDRCDK